jgi:hypothetical protein
MASGDAFDLQLGVEFAVTDLLAETLPTLHLEGNDLVALTFAENLCVDFHRNIAADRDVSIVVNQQHLGKRYLVARVSLKMGNVQFLARFDLELLTGYLYYCEHDFPEFRTAKVGNFIRFQRIARKKLLPPHISFSPLVYLLFNAFRYMKIKSFLARPFASYVHKQIHKGMVTALEDQHRVFRDLLKTGQLTEFGREHHLADVQDHAAFTRAVPIRDYEQFKPWIERIKEGKHNVLWKGQPIYFAKTSGTTSGVKYIPISRESIPNHINTARNALLCYMAESGNHAFANGKMIFLSGSPELERVGGVPTGRLSGIINHHIPSYLRKNQLPSYETNCVEDWEEKLDKIIGETIDQDMTLISGIPPWMQMYFDRLVRKSGKPVKDLFPNFSIMVHGGVNFMPYRDNLMQTIGRTIDTVETFPASEGFFAFQDTRDHQAGLLLNTDSGIFFEFIPAQEIFSENPTRLTLSEVKTGVNYALIVNNNAGLWGYNIGDTVRFLSINPWRIEVTGRIKHFISAFGEHVIGEEVEYSLMKTAKAAGVGIVEFTVAPLIRPGDGQSCHEWFVEFEQIPADMEGFSRSVDENLRKKNIYYDDLIRGNILRPLVMRPLKRGAFIEYMKSIGKLGGQNKVPRLSNDRTLADAMCNFQESTH